MENVFSTALLVKIPARISPVIDAGGVVEGFHMPNYFLQSLWTKTFRNHSKYYVFLQIK